jgi:hypothetical protein
MLPDRGRFQYKLQAHGGMALDAPMSDALDINESDMSVWLNFADGNRRDQVGDLCEVAGIDTSRHRTNPLALLEHGRVTPLPIGMCCARNERGQYDVSQYRVEIDPQQKVAKACLYFYQGGNKSLGPGGDEHAIMCEQLFHMVAQKMLGCGSIGYVTLASTPLPPDFALGIPAGQHLLKTLLLEVSLVTLPANQDTARKCLDMRWCGHPTSPILKKSLERFTGPRRAFMGW